MAGEVEMARLSRPADVSDVPEAVTAGTVVLPWPPWLASERRRVVVLTLLAGLIALPLAAVNTELHTDVAAFYAPMARAFAEGDWAAAYYYQIPPLLPTIGGLLAKLGLAPFLAVKLASALFFVTTVPPLYGLLRRIWGADIAVWAGCLYVTCLLWLRTGGDGLLESSSTCLLVTALFALLRLATADAWRWSATLGLAAGLLALARGEGVMFVPFLLLAVLILVGRRSWRLAWGYTGLAAGVMLLTMGPWMAYNWRVTGLPLTDGRQLMLVAPLAQRLGWRLPPSLPGFASGRLAEVVKLEVVKLEVVKLEVVKPEVMTAATPAALSAAVLKSSVLEGLQLGLPLLVLAGLLGWRQRAKWSPGRWLLLGAVVIHNGLMVLLVLMSDVPCCLRFFSGVWVLLLGWVVGGMLVAVAWLHRWLPRWSPAWSSGVLALLLAAGPVCLYRYRMTSAERNPRQRAARQCGAWLCDPGCARLGPTKRLRSTAGSYQNGHRPVVLAGKPEAAFWAGGDYVKVPLAAGKVTVDELAAYCARRRVDYIVLDERVDRLCPGLRQAAGAGGVFAAEISVPVEAGTAPWLIIAFHKRKAKSAAANGVRFRGAGRA